MKRLSLVSSDGVRINARTYRSVVSKGKMPAVVVCHGFAASHQELQNMYNVEFARRGFYVVAIDFRGHGDSDGSIPAFPKVSDVMYEEYFFHDEEEYALMEAWSLGLVPDVRAAIDFLSSCEEVDPDKIALVGHSMGGGAAFYTGFLDPRVRSVAVIAPAIFYESRYMNASSPRNLLLAVGEDDELIEPWAVLRILWRTISENSTRMPEVDRFYGSYSDGTARKMILSPGVDHFWEAFDPYIAEEAIRWTEAALNVESSYPVLISSDRTILMYTSVLSAIVLPFPVVDFLFFLLNGKMRNFKSKCKGYAPSSNFAIPTHLLFPAHIYVGVLFLGPLVVLLPIVLLFFKGEWRAIFTLGLTSVAFADTLLCFYATISIPLLVCLFAFKSMRKELRLMLINSPRSNMISSIFAGLISSLILFLSINATLGWCFIDLFPTAKELVLMLTLFSLLFPLVLIDESWLRWIFQKNLLLSKHLRLVAVTLLYLLTKLPLIAVCGYFVKSFLLFLVVFLLAFALLLTWIFDRTQDIFGNTLLTSFLSSWVLAAVMPFLR